MKREKAYARGVGRKASKSTGVFRLLIALCALMTVALAILCGVAWRKSQMAVPVYQKTGAVQPKPAQAAPSIPETPAAPPLAQEPFLLLVNEWNPIPDGYQLALVDVTGTSHQMQPEPAAQLEKMIADGRAQGLDLVVRSAYRNHEQQVQNFQRKLNTYLAQGLSQETAEEYTRASIATPGRSEHETGLAADIATSTTGVLGPTFAQTAEYTWLHEHCAEYGFVLRYPENMQDVTGVWYEPWHYRYVGAPYAADIMAQNVTLEEYLAADAA